MRFKGKGYYMYKNLRNTIAPKFGYAHRVYVYGSSTSVKPLSKTKIIIFGLSKHDILTTAYNLKSVKTINIFTGRGIRFARQVVYKKIGKVTAYR
jgi:ribosomal protein L6P/L9E